MSHDDKLKEWEETRLIISRFDGYLDGLRKYGFSFIATLLAASSVQCFISLDKNTRAMLILLAIIFILGLRLLDYYYEIIMQAAAKRSKALEKLLGFGIYDEISYKFSRQNLPLGITGVYSVFLLVAVILGYLVENAPSTNTNFTNTTVVTATSTGAIVNTTITNITVETTTITTTGFFSNILQSGLFWFIVAVIGLTIIWFIHRKCKDSSIE